MLDVDLIVGLGFDSANAEPIHYVFTLFAKLNYYLQPTQTPTRSEERNNGHNAACSRRREGNTIRCRGTIIHH